MTESVYLDMYRRAGYVSMCVGHEGMVDLPSFTLRGNLHSTLRKRFNRLTREGYRLVVCEPPISDSILHELRQISDEWLEMTHGEEKRFFLARFDEEYLRQEQVALVYMPAGGICAFANLAPEYQRKGLSIDLMRRRQRFESGTMDFLFVSLLFWGRAHGYTTFNLGLSPLFGLGLLPCLSFVERILQFVYTVGSFIEYKGLNAFKVKFRPTWKPLFMVHPAGLVNLPWAGLAVAKANAGESETLWNYFKVRSKRVQHEEPEIEPLPAADIREELPGEILAK